MKDFEFIHVGLTVSNIAKAVEFYKKLGFELEFQMTFPAEFIASVPQLYRQEAGVYSDAAFLKSPNGVELELFRFSSNRPAKPADWNQPGFHHICLKVNSVPETYQKLLAQGVEFFFEPGLKGDPKDNRYWIFMKDPDGNMIELQD
jgi:lactoylglutathione lyase